ncbi:MAG: TPM domain-containing protein [Pyrinomonadaceae bacterium]
MSAPVKLRACVLASIVMIAAGIAVLAQGEQSGSQDFSINTSPLPAPTGFVNDFAGVIDAATKQQLEEKLKNFRDTSSPSTEIAVVVVRTTGERDIFDYSLAVARGWKIGSQEDDNPSALLLVAIDDRKYFTQISRDLEDELPDALAGSIQRQYLVPEFRKGNYAKGIADTVDAYIRTINERRGGIASATPTPTPRSGTPARIRSSGSGLICFIGIGILLLIVMLSSRGGRGGRGGWGGGGGGDVLPWIIGSMIANAASSRGGSSSDWGGFGGGFGGGGGGFGGFGGGGDFGGGGSGGSW